MYNSWSVASLQEKLLNLWRDIKWVVSTASKPDEEELNLTAKFLALTAFIAGAFQIVFHVAGVYINHFVYGTPLYTLGDPVKETVAMLVSITLIFIGLLYLMTKLR
jgi:preprotein translocase subunit Sss1